MMAAMLLALHLFAYQYKNNLPYQAYCLQQGRTPRTVKMWSQISSVPINAFKEVALSSNNPNEAERIFMTSGTNSAAENCFSRGCSRACPVFSL